MQELIKITANEQGKRITSAKELYLGLGLNKSNWSRWYPTNIENNEFFKENTDWIGVRRYDEGNETKDFAITIEFAKHLAMMSKSKKSHEYRNYFIECENKLKEATQFKLPNTYKEALLQLVKQVEENEKLGLENSELKEENKLKELENRLLSGEAFSWAGTSLINALVRTYSTSVYGDFSKGWNDFKKNLLYSHSINLNSRITAYLNKTGKKTKPKTLSLLSDDEIPNAISTIISMCKEEKVNINNNLKHYSEGDK
jgi:anti-repressor protein